MQYGIRIFDRFSIPQQDDITIGYKFCIISEGREADDRKRVSRIGRIYVHAYISISLQICRIRSLNMMPRVSPGEGTDQYTVLQSISNEIDRRIETITQEGCGTRDRCLENRDGGGGGTGTARSRRFFSRFSVGI